jgi:xanthine dehydrogenase accessory factor
LSGISEIAPDPIDALLLAHSQHQRAGLATLLAIHGSAPCAIGAQLALVITAKGERVVTGTLSGGCLDAAVVQELALAIERRSSFRIRFGKDSPYIDITLPCGSGVDVQFDGALSAEFLQILAHAWRARAAQLWHWPEPENAPQCIAVKPVPSNQIARTIYKAPRLRLLLAGRGANLLSACRVANAAQIELIALCPDHDSLAQLAPYTQATHLLQASSVLAACENTVDAFTAVLLMFHEHEWEQELLCSALATPAFWLGAMGSPRAHAARIDALRQRGFAAAELARIRGPVGAVAQTRTPEEFALSALAEICGAYRAHVEQAARHALS